MNFEAPDADCSQTPASVRTAISRASSETRTSGGRTSDGDARPRAIAATPASRSLVCHSPSQAMPSDTTTSPQAGICGTSTVESGQDAVVRATQTTASPPHPIGFSSRNSSRNGISGSDSTPAGRTHRAVSGTAAMLAITK